MTLQQFFDMLSAHPELIAFYFTAVPLTAWIAGILGRGEGHHVPWKNLYCVLIYMATIPGIFAVILNIYFFLFERRPIMETNLYTQVLPIVIMILTLYIIKRNVPFDLVPGFDKISGFMMISFSVLALMWFIDRTYIIAISFMPFWVVLLMVLIGIIVVRLGLKRVMK